MEKEVNPFERSYPFSEVRALCDRLGLNEIYDLGGDNFIDSPDGGQYYIDKLHLDDKKFSAKMINTISRFMNDNNYSEKDKEIVLNSINRINTLAN